ncbi:MAG: penicillin-binding transpeptidase domain-containing protein [Chloroflexi bacterium]|nr:penicillin-binding transpeptidase domain-containing protein [Chloroflexota bacterium]
MQRDAQSAFGRRYGGAVVVRVSDGRILALVNPDLSCRRLHAPGSIFKLVTAFAALQENVTRESETFRCGGYAKLGGVVIHCTTPNGHGTRTLIEAIAQSCNVTFYELGVRLGPDRLIKYARDFGLDSKCPTYSGSQAVGALPAAPIHPCEVARLAIGQASGFKITLLEAAGMVRRISMGHIEGKRAAKNLAIVRKGMRLAVTSGTCTSAAISGVEIAGKTGTFEAEGQPSERSAWFVGFAPYGKPKVVVVVFANRGHGYDTAAPIARRIFAAYFGKRDER